MRNNSTRWLMGLAALSFLLGASCPASAELITNGGFENGTYSGWTLTNSYATGYNGIDTNAADAHSGNYSFFFGNPGPPEATLSQTFADTIGTSYTFRFWLSSQGGTDNSAFSANFDGTTLLSVTNVPAGGYVQYNYTVVGTGSDTVSFSGENYDTQYNLDDVSVAIPTAAVPEPNSLVLSGVASLLMGGLAWRKRKRTA